MAIKEVDPISRIEGHLGVKCTVSDTTGYITDAEAHGNLWRGFENFLLGREPNDAITFTQRICGVCPVPHGQTSTFAVEAALGYNSNFQTWIAGGTQTFNGADSGPVPAGQGIPAKAVHIRNLVLSSEFLMSSITHQYHLAAPSYIQGPNIPPWTPYFADSFYHPYLQATGKGSGTLATSNANQPAQPGATLPLDDAGFSKDLWSAVIKSYVHALRIRRLTFEAGAMFAGRMPMTSSFVAGGVSTNKSENLSAKCTKFFNLTKEIGMFIIQEYVPIFLALGALYPNYDNLANATTLNTYYPTLWAAGNQDTGSGAPGALNTGWGAGLGNFLSWGAFPQSDGTLGLARGYKIGSGAVGTISAADVAANLKEVITHSRYKQAGGYTSDTAYPGDVSRTVPDRNGGITKYSWMKAPRYLNTAMEVGPMARMYVSGLFQTGVPLATSIAAYVPLYTKAATGHPGTGVVGAPGLGLDPAAIAPDLAVALVRAGLAELWVGATQIVTLPPSQAAIVAAYTDPAAYIMGPIRNWVVNLTAGWSTMDRLRARALESLVLVQKMIGAVSKSGGVVSFPAMGGWVGELNALPAGAASYTDKPYPVGTTSGFGGCEAPRGALMHFCTQTAGKIDKYQCVVPTTWNGSPKDNLGNPGAIEKAVIGAKYAATTTAATGGGGNPITAGGGVEALRIAQSFDPCIACAVH